MTVFKEFVNDIEQMAKIETNGKRIWNKFETILNNI